VINVYIHIMTNIVPECYWVASQQVLAQRPEAGNEPKGLDLRADNALRS
jgi:hypothetical protein